MCIRDRSVTAGLFHVLKGLHHMNLALYDTYGTLVDIRRVILLRISLHQSFSAVHRKRFREAVAAYGYDSHFYRRYVYHSKSSLYISF